MEPRRASQRVSKAICCRRHSKMRTAADHHQRARAQRPRRPRNASCGAATGPRIPRVAQGHSLWGKGWLAGACRRVDGGLRVHNRRQVFVALLLESSVLVLVRRLALPVRHRLLPAGISRRRVLPSTATGLAVLMLAVVAAVAVSLGLGPPACSAVGSPRTGLTEGMPLPDFARCRRAHMTWPGVHPQ